MRRLLLLLLFSLPAGAQSSGVIVIPAAPTNQTVVELRVFLPCPRGPATVAVSPGLIKVHFEESGHLCGDPPIPQPYSVFVPVFLVAREYRVEVTTAPDNDVILSTTFVVRNALPVPFRVQPSVVRLEWAGAKQLAIESAQPLCTIEANCRVFVDNLQATGVTLRPESNAIIFTAPELEPGFSEVRVENGAASTTVKDALFAVSEAAESANPSLFEPVLFPLLLEAPGANGSLWRTEAALSNPKPWPAYSWEGQLLPPGGFLRFEGGNEGRGLVLRIPRDQAPHVSFGLRARDVSRVEEGYGTEIPVVRERDFFFDAPFTFLDVPVERGYRVKLRLYALTTGFPSAAVAIAPAGGPLTTTYVPWVRVCRDSGCHLYAELDLPSDGGDGARADVTVEQLHVPVWGFITVTNNETQQVTVVTPGGKGGRQ